MLVCAFSKEYILKKKNQLWKTKDRNEYILYAFVYEHASLLII